MDRLVRLGFRIQEQHRKNSIVFHAVANEKSKNTTNNFTYNNP